MAPETSGAFSLLGQFGNWYVGTFNSKLQLPNPKHFTHTFSDIAVSMSKRQNIFGQPIIVKKNIIRLFGLVSYAGFNWSNKPRITGSVHLTEVPEANVMIVSNHQTYFADVALMHHVIHSALKGRIDNIRYPGFLRPKHNIYVVAADETMKSGLLPRLMALSGTIQVKRTWRKDGENVKRPVDQKDTDNISKALSDGWVISFPQGTTKPFMPGRKGTAHIIKQHKPVVIPVVIDGFRRAFDKKGIYFKKKGTTLRMRIKAPIALNYDADPESILNQVMTAIEQTPEHNLVEN